ncbi:hypothetical protein M758_1G031400 [Ceratodon purpureus]|nr:hypothetical protein M758_1G031400 [Ceratodon purpureus]
MRSVCLVLCPRKLLHMLLSFLIKSRGAGIGVAGIWGARVSGACAAAALRVSGLCVE